MSTDRATLKILLVDDSDDDRCFFRWTFQKSGISGELLQAEDGEEAIKLLSQMAAARSASSELPHTTFLDLKMPGRNGFEVLQWIREQPGFKNLRVFVLTGSDAPSDMERARELGAAGYIVKPVTAEKIREIVKPAEE
jgi:CheY-like chemotaxis protein